MVAILLPAAGVARRRLDGAVGIRANPHVGPGRRDRQRVEPFPGVRVSNTRTVRGVVDPTRPGTASTDAGKAIRDVVEPGEGGRFATLVGPGRGHRMHPIPPHPKRSLFLFAFPGNLPNGLQTPSSPPSSTPWPASTH